VGIIGPLRADKKGRTVPVHPVARKYIVRATWIGIAVTGVLIVVGACCLDDHPGEPWFFSVIRVAMIALILVPSLAFLPVGAAAMIGALGARAKATQIPDPEERKQMGAGMRLAWRITWKSLAWSTFASGFGYLVMYLIALFLD